jgi:hypothetical protein
MPARQAASSCSHATTRHAGRRDRRPKGLPAARHRVWGAAVGNCWHDPVSARTRTLTLTIFSMSTRDIVVTARPIQTALYLRPKARRLRRHQPRTATPLRHAAVIGHMKIDGHLGRCHLKGREGDAANVILTAVGHNLRRLIVLALVQAFATRSALRSASQPKACRRKGQHAFGFLTARVS